MKIEQANSISLTELLDKLGFRPTKGLHGDETKYVSPLRDERIASFYVNSKKNSWHDHGTGEGGGPIQFAIAYRKSQGNDHAHADALKFLEAVMGTDWEIVPRRRMATEDSPPKYKVLLIDPVKEIALIDCLQKRGIPIEVAERYLKQLRVQNRETKKKFTTLGLENEEGGWELFGPYGKYCVKPKAITFIRGTIAKPSGIHVFEGVADFLSVIVQRNGVPLENATIILNSVALRKKAETAIKGFGYEYAYTWMDNDEAGARTKAELDKFFQTQDMVHRPQNARYADFKDVNEHHIAQVKRHIVKLKLGE